VTIALGPIIAERILTVVGSKARVHVRLGKPKKDRISGDYTCPFIIEGLGDSTVQQAFGIDAMQALQLAMQAIRKALHPYAKRLSWVGSPPGGLGFPMMIPEVFGVKFSQRLEGIVQRETDRLGRSLERASRNATGGLTAIPKKKGAQSRRLWRSKNKNS
jgi:hypothetical protein